MKPEEMKQNDRANKAPKRPWSKPTIEMILAAKQTESGVTPSDREAGAVYFPS